MAKYDVTLVGKKTYRTGRYSFLKGRSLRLSEEQAEEFKGDSRFRVVKCVPVKPPPPPLVDESQYEELEESELEESELEESELEESEPEEEEEQPKPKAKRKKKKKRSKLRRKVRREADGEG